MFGLPSSAIKSRETVFSESDEIGGCSKTQPLPFTCNWMSTGSPVSVKTIALCSSLSWETAYSPSNSFSLSAFWLRWYAISNQLLCVSKGRHVRHYVWKLACRVTGMDRLLSVIFMNNVGIATMTVNTNHVFHRGAMLLVGLGCSWQGCAGWVFRLPMA